PRVSSDIGRSQFGSTSEPEDPHRPDNLWKPVEGDHGAHGRFDDCAHKTSWEQQVTHERLWIGAGFAVVAAQAYFSPSIGILKYQVRSAGNFERFICFACYVWKAQN